jgi:hypothetical protein
MLEMTPKWMKLKKDTLRIENRVIAVTQCSPIVYDKEKPIDAVARRVTIGATSEITSLMKS